MLVSASELSNNPATEISPEAQMPKAESILMVKSSVASMAQTDAHTRSVFQQIVRGLTLVGLGVLSYLFISHFIVQSVTVVGLSMTPTLQDSHRYLLNRWVYYVHAPRRSDVVVLRDPADNGLSVKRIVAVAGESVSVKGGNIYVNGRELDEPYLGRGTITLTTFPLKEQSFQCGPDQFFVLGDNRNNSLDSRTYGPVSRRNILGLLVP